MTRRIIVSLKLECQTYVGVPIVQCVIKGEFLYIISMAINVKGSDLHGIFTCFQSARLFIHITLWSLEISKYLLYM